MTNVSVRGADGLKLALCDLHDEIIVEASEAKAEQVKSFWQRLWLASLINYLKNKYQSK